MSKLIEFYNFRGKTQDGYSFEDIKMFSLDKLETCHSYIQWVFPLKERSKAVPSSPVLTSEDVEDIHKYKMELFLIVNMLPFYGLVYNDKFEAIDRGPHWDERKATWITPRNHNYLRLTRILKSLCLLGMKPLAVKLRLCLNEIHEANRSDISDITMQFWDEAIK